MRLGHRRTGFAAIVILLALSSGLHSAEPPRWDFSALLRRTCRFERLYEAPGHWVGMASSHDRTLANGDSGAVKRFVNDHHNVTGYHQALVELDGQSSVLAWMVYGLDLVKMSRSGEYYYIYDPLGSTRALMDDQAAVTDTYAYDAYGNIIEQDPQPPNGTENAYLFTGERLDGFTGCYYLRARFYDPATGRFTQLDTFLGSPQDPLSLHRYVYCHADPANLWDPSGHTTVAQVQVTMAMMFMATAITVAVILQSQQDATNMLGEALADLFARQSYALSADSTAWSIPIRNAQGHTAKHGGDFGIDPNDPKWGRDKARAGYEAVCRAMVRGVKATKMKAQQIAGKNYHYYVISAVRARRFIRQYVKQEYLNKGVDVVSKTAKNVQLRVTMVGDEIVEVVSCFVER